MEGQHPAQDDHEEVVQVGEREVGEGVWEQGWGRMEEEQEDMMRMRRLMVVRERLQEAERLPLPDEVEQEDGGGIQVRIQAARERLQDARERERMLPAIPPQQVAGEVVEDPRVRLGRIRAELHQAGAGAGVQRQPLGIQVRIQNAGAGGGGIQAPEAPEARLEAAGGVGADAAGVDRDAEQLE